MPATEYETRDFEDAIELFHRKGWTDGLPIVPPTADRVAQFLHAAGRQPDDLIGFYETRKRPVTAEKLAINAVMAGCLPEHFPLVIALVEALLDSGVPLHAANSSTSSITFGFVINGPIRQALGMNSQGNVLGPGNRANACIGRAIRLIQINVMGSVPGAGVEDPAHGLSVLDRSTMGQPAKYAGYHIVENEEAFPSLTPLHVELGFQPTDSTATVFAVAGSVWVDTHAETTPEAWIDTFAQYVVGTGRLMTGGYGVVLLPPENARIFVEAGWTKADIRTALFEATRRSVAWVKSNGWKPAMMRRRFEPIEPADETTFMAAAASAAPNDLHVVVCGGPAGSFPFFLYTYAARLKSATRRIG